MPHDCTKRRTQTESSIAHLLRIAPINADLNSFRPKRQKMRAEIDQDNSMAKSPPAPDFCVSEPANTRVFIHEERKRGIMSRWDGIVKIKSWTFHSVLSSLGRIFPATEQKNQGTPFIGPLMKNGIRP